MKKFLLAFFACLVVLATFQTIKAQESSPIQHYEYASFSSMGNKSCIVWPDGTVLHLSEKFKRPDDTNEKMFYETMAFNILDKAGYSIYHGDSTPLTVPYQFGHEDDLMFRRPLK